MLLLFTNLYITPYLTPYYYHQSPQVCLMISLLGPYLVCIYIYFFLSFLDMIFFNKPLKEKRIKALKTSHITFGFHPCYSFSLF